MKRYGTFAIGLGAAALLMSAATAASASTGAPQQRPALSVSPMNVRPGASVIVNATCAGHGTPAPGVAALKVPPRIATTFFLDLRW